MSIKQKDKALIISNKNIICSDFLAGGVVKCSKEFFNLIENCFEQVTYQTVEVDFRLISRIKRKIGVDVYNQYVPEKYIDEIKNKIACNSIKYIFLNMSDTMVFAKPLKELYGEDLKIVLLSHGNESGDFIHEITRFEEFFPFYKNLTANYKLGSQLKLEYKYRLKYIDLVLTVSEIESQFEALIGAKNTLFIPRIIEKHPVEFNPALNRVGFFGDISHFPNFYGIKILCEALENEINEDFRFRIVGRFDNKLEKLKEKYPFLDVLGYLNYDDLQKEASTWSFFLNLVFYYSKGVSTKLADAISWGIPIITTHYGNRGYLLSEDSLPVVKDEKEMAEYIIENIDNIKLLDELQQKVLKIHEFPPKLENNSEMLLQKLTSI